MEDTCWWRWTERLISSATAAAKGGWASRALQWRGDVGFGAKEFFLILLWFPRSYVCFSYYMDEFLERSVFRLRFRFFSVLDNGSCGLSLWGGPFSRQLNEDNSSSSICLEWRIHTFCRDEQACYLGKQAKLYTVDFEIIEGNGCRVCLRN